MTQASDSFAELLLAAKRPQIRCHPSLEADGKKLQAQLWESSGRHADLALDEFIPADRLYALDLAIFEGWGKLTGITQPEPIAATVERRFRYILYAKTREWWQRITTQQRVQNLGKIQSRYDTDKL